VIVPQIIRAAYISALQRIDGGGLIALRIFVHEEMKSLLRLVEKLMR
jgi:hypothetical protein